MNRLDLSEMNRTPTSDVISQNEIELQSHSPGSSIKDGSEDIAVSGTTSMMKRAADRLFHKHELDRALERPHIAGRIIVRH